MTLEVSLLTHDYLPLSPGVLPSLPTLSNCASQRGWNSSLSPKRPGRASRKGVVNMNKIVQQFNTRRRRSTYLKWCELEALALHQIRSRKTRKSNDEAAKRAATMRITLLDLSLEILVQIALNFGYPTALFLLACNKYISGLLTVGQLDVIKSRDPEIILKGEKVLVKQKQKGMNFNKAQWNVFGRYRIWYGHELPCYRCPEWLVTSHPQSRCLRRRLAL
jgi:hypothetical protein